MSEQEDIFSRHEQESVKFMKVWAGAVVLILLFTVWFMLSE